MVRRDINAIDMAAPETPEEVLALDEALTRLAAADVVTEAVEVGVLTPPGTLAPLTMILPVMPRLAWKVHL